MGLKVRRVKGTRDLLPPDTEVWAAVEEVARRVFGTYGYGEIRTPILEDTELFVRSVGESTDIVRKEMYSFSDKKGRSLTLRPESTAAVVRAFVENGLREWPSPVRLFYCGPHFRYEQPQEGRYRQFNQIGAELIGDPGPMGDAELLLMLMRFLGELGFTDLVVLLNTVGDQSSRGDFSQALRQYLQEHRESLSEDSRRRLATNPLRILDSKLAHEREILAQAPRLWDHLNQESREHFEAVGSALDQFGISYKVDDRLVRGLDYYTRTVFEIVSEKLGAQNAILGGGRYDGLMAELGGGEIPAIGFAIGEDRLIQVLSPNFVARHRAPPPVLVVPVGVDAGSVLTLAEELRAQGVATLAELSGRSTRAALKRAGKLGLTHVVLLGEDEVAAAEVTLKSFETGAQERIARNQLAHRLLERQ